MARACRGLDLVLFADDTNIFAEDKDPAELFRRMGEGLAELSRWFRCNRLTLNLKKTEYVYFGGQGGHREAFESLSCAAMQTARRTGESETLEVASPSHPLTVNSLLVEPRGSRTVPYLS